MSTRILFCALVAFAGAFASAQAQPRIQIKRQDDKGLMQVVVDGKEAIVFRHGKEVDLPHYFPVNSPSGKPLTVQRTEPYPHHRSFWFADTVQFNGKKISFYSALYTGTPAPKPAADTPKDAPKQYPTPPYRDTIRVVEISPGKCEQDQGQVTARFVWEADLGKTPVLDEVRSMRIVALGAGEYFLDMKFTVTATYGDVIFASDAVHYGWPFIRIAPEFTPAKGGTLINSEGGVSDKQTNMKIAKWVDYSNKVGEEVEGLAMFSHAENEHPHKWLTRDYGTFGPRRIDEKSGKPFTIKKGESISTRAGILIHKGNSKTGKVAERYEMWIGGKL